MNKTIKELLKHFEVYKQEVNARNNEKQKKYFNYAIFKFEEPTLQGFMDYLTKL